MAFYLVKFVEDELYHICPQNKVKLDGEEEGLVSAKYKGIYFRAVVVAEGSKDYLEKFREQCERNDRLVSKFRITEPSTSPNTSESFSPLHPVEVRRTLFPEESSSVLPSTSAICYSHQDDNVPSSSCTFKLQSNPFEVIQGPSDNEAETLNIVQLSACPVENEQGNKVERKKQYCPFCRNMYSKLGRHLFQVHKNEKLIADILHLPPNHKERKRVIAILRAKGNSIFNSTKSPSKPLITPRIKRNTTDEDYVSCFMCHGKYKKLFYYRHVKRCPNSDGSLSIRSALKMAKSVELKVDDESEVCIQYKSDVISGIKNGDIKDTILSDPLIQTYGKYLCLYYGQDRHLINLIRRKLRQVATLLLEIKKLDNDVQYLEDIFQPKKIDITYSAIKNITHFNKGSFKKPAFAIQLAPVLQQCAQRLLNIAIEADNEQQIKLVSRWMKYFKSEYNSRVSKHAHRTLDSKKWNKPRTLPLTDDLFKLNKHLQTVMESASKELEEGFSYNAWANLNKSLMTKILVFNRKRVGEVQRIRIEDISKAHNIQKGSATYELLSEAEKIVCSEYMRVEVRGKHAKVVPILLTKQMLAGMKKIINLRKEANIPSSNPFVFAKKDDLPFEASAILTEFAYECGAENPKLITGTKMRKHIATVSQAFNFSQNDLSILAGYLGHTLQTHNQFYRLPDEAIHLSKISNLLRAVDLGHIDQLKGKGLHELEEVLQSIGNNPETEKNLDDPMLDKPSTSQKTPKKRTIIRRTWTTPEKIAMRNVFKKHITDKVLPTPMECNMARNKHSPLQRRTVAQLKAWVNNCIVKLSKGND